MVKIPAFEVEQWMDKYETTPGVLNIAETCASSISIEQLKAFDTRGNAAPKTVVDLSTRLAYGAIRGSDGLRRNIADLYGVGDDGETAIISPDNVLVTQGAISANHLIFYTLVGPGDHVICVHPTYQQLYSVPESLGAEVSLWELKAEEGYVMNITRLKAMIKDNTKMIVINNPNNPTGATTPGNVLSQIIDIARAHDVVVFSDEVYRPLFHSLKPEEIPPTVLSLGYSKVVVTSSMSKAWALAGIRVGWIASPDAAMIDKIASTRDYTTISVSQLDDQVARYALDPNVRPGLAARNTQLARTNLALLESFIEDHRETCSWVKPTAGTTAFVQFRTKGGGPVDDEAFCKDVLDKTKVMFLPGYRCFGRNEKGFEGFVRIGYVNETEVLREALENLDAYVKQNLT